MDRLATLLTVPNRSSLVNRTLTDNAFLGTLGKFLYKEGALLCQVIKLAEEVLVVVFDLSLVTFVFALFLVVLDFFLGLNWSVFNVLYVRKSRTKLSLLIELRSTSLASKFNSFCLVLQSRLELLLSFLVNHL